MDKIILMGLAQSGKTTIIKVAAEGYVPKKDAPYSATIDYRRKTYNLFGKQVSLFDLGGQKSFLERFVGDLANFIFTNLNVLVYIVDVTQISELSLCQYYLDLAVQNIKKFSPEAKICIFLHKLDLIDRERKESYIKDIKEFFHLSEIENVTFYETTVFNDSAIKAMERVVNSLKEEPKTLESITKNYYMRLQKNIQDIYLLNDEGKLIYSNQEKFPDYKKREIEILRSLDLNYEESNEFTFFYFKSMYVFSTFLKNGSFLSINYGKIDFQSQDDLNSTLISSSVKLRNDLNNFISPF
jgi:GTPase SAR1 family protein